MKTMHPARWVAFALLSLMVVALPGQQKAFLRLQQTIPLPNVTGRIDHMDIDVKGQRLLIAGLENGSLEVVDLKSGKWQRSIPGFKKPQGIAYVPALNKVFVASGDDGMVRVFRGDTLQLLTAIKLELGPNRVAYDPRSKRLYVGYGGKDAGKDYGEVGVIDAKTDKHIGDIKVAAHPAELLLDASGKSLFALIPAKSQVQLIDTRQRKVISTWPVNSQRPGDAALDEKNHRLMLGTRTPPTMTVIDSDSGKEIANLPTVAGMDGVYFDAASARIFVSGGGTDAGAVFIYQQQGADNYSLLQEMPTRPDAGTALWVPELKRYYIAAPASGSEGAAILVYAPVR